ncbi:MAG: PQQ-dependent sugar dehydrogenase [Oligoflexia bacterium]|nr:PQQ-dependent sugar dehydrogenase [Oligoflexia bacterium]
MKIQHATLVANIYFLPLALLGLAAIPACSGDNSGSIRARTPISANGGPASCELVNSGPFGPAGTTALHTQAVVTGLVTPWEVSILPGGSDWLVTERPGRLRLIRQGSLAPTPVLTVSTVQSGEGGLLGMALDPQFASNSKLYVYYTAPVNDSYVNRVQQYTLSADHTTATAGPVILDNITWNTVHDGGRIKFGPDGMLYVSTGEGNDPTLPANPNSLNGKILRIASDGSIPADNPQPGNPWFIKGLRNAEAFDWLDAKTLIIADNGPTGEYNGEYGGDKVLVAQKGQDMGWPTIWHCETQAGLVAPILTWVDALPPGGALVYTGTSIPDWQGNLLIASTGAEQLHRVVLTGPTETPSVQAHEVYLQGETAPGLGRLRAVFQDQQGNLYVTTSNCDSRGSCPPAQDGIYRILPGS